MWGICRRGAGRAGTRQQTPLRPQALGARGCILPVHALRPTNRSAHDWIGPAVGVALRRKQEQEQLQKFAEMEGIASHLSVEKHDAKVGRPTFRLLPPGQLHCRRSLWVHQRWSFYTRMSKDISVRGGAPGRLVARMDEIYFAAGAGDGGEAARRRWMAMREVRRLRSTTPQRKRWFEKAHEYCLARQSWILWEGPRETMARGRSRRKSRRVCPGRG
jgi:hypothetical protein